MARPLKWNSSLAGVQEMTDAEISYTVYRVLRAFAESGATGTSTGELNGGSGTAIGTWTDQERDETVGTHPATGSTNTVTNTIYQVRTTTTISSTRPLYFSNPDFYEMSDSDLNARIIQLAANEMAAGGIGSYQLSTGAPSGGTWQTRITLTDRRQSGDITYYIWQKTDDTAPSTIRPIKWGSGVGGLQEMNDAELNSLVDALREYIRTTGVGFYSFGSSAPGTGTWVNQGSATDTRQQTGEVGYTGTYYQFADYTGTYYQFADYTGTYYQFADYTGTFRASIGYVSTYSGWNGPTYYQFADYTNTFRRTNPYYGTYRRTNPYYGTYRRTIGYSGTYRRTIGYSGTYTGTTIQSGTETVSTQTLWLRTA